MSRSKIGPHEVLPMGSVVIVGGTKRGKVEGHWTADNGVVVHRIAMTHKITRGVGRSVIWKSVPEKRIEPNYSFVEVEKT